MPDTWGCGSRSPRLRLVALKILLAGELALGPVGADVAGKVSEGVKGTPAYAIA
jgi:hypothetical protein